MLDASAVLALLLCEPGSEQVAAVLPGALLSTLNLAEVLSKLCERGMPLATALMAVRALGIETIAFSETQAEAVAALRMETKPFGLSLGDRACLALARERGANAITADSAWRSLQGFEIVPIREQ